MYYWHRTRQAEHNHYWSVVKSYTLVFFFLLCRYLHCCLQAGNDSDTTWHFLGWQHAGLNETRYCSFPTPWALSAQQMSKTHFRPGWEGEGKVDITTGRTSPHHTVGATVQPPSPGTLHSGGQLLGELGAGVMWPQRGTVSFWHNKWALLPEPQPQNHRQITAIALRLRVLWLGGISRRRWHTGFGYQTLMNPGNMNFKPDIWLPFLHLGFLCISIPPLNSLHVTGLTAKEQVILTFNFH